MRKKNIIMVGIACAGILAGICSIYAMEKEYKSQIAEMSAHVNVLETSVANYHTRWVNQIETITSLNDEMSTLTNEVTTLNNKISVAEDSLASLAEQNSILKQVSSKLVYVGEFTITHYCNEHYAHICNDGVHFGLTASGATVQAGVTIAVDKTKIPFGTQVYIDGYGLRIAQDTGGAIKGNKIDVAVNTHAEASRLGTVKKDVWVIMK